MKYLGQATIRWGGNVIDTKKGAALDIGGVKRNSVVTGTKVGFSEETMQSVLECATSLTEGMSLDELRQISGAAITFECDTGQVYSISGGWLSEPPKISDQEGEVTLKFEGPAAEEIL